MNVVAREPEIKRLEKLYRSKKAEFLAIYGRHRVGKTFLIRFAFWKKKGVFFNVTGSKDGTYKDQISSFTRRIGEVFFNGVIPTPGKNWNEAFNQLTNAINQIGSPDIFGELFHLFLYAHDFYENKYKT